MTLNSTWLDNIWPDFSVTISRDPFFLLAEDRHPTLTRLPPHTVLGDRPWGASPSGLSTPSSPLVPWTARGCPVRTRRASMVASPAAEPVRCNDYNEKETCRNPSPGVRTLRDVGETGQEGQGGRGFQVAPPCPPPPLNSSTFSVFCKLRFPLSFYLKKTF